MSDANTKDALDAGRQLGSIAEKIADVNGVPIALVPAGMSVAPLEKAMQLADQRAAAPRRRKGIAKLVELDSFVAHVNRFKDPQSVIFADPEAMTVTAVLDYHPAGDTAPRWGEHRSVYECPTSDAWDTWTGHNGAQMTQDQFAEFIDANMKDLASAPPGSPISADCAEPGAVLSMARQLSIRTKGTFDRSVNETTGEFSLTNKTEHETGSTKIPRSGKRTVLARGSGSAS